MKRHRLGLIVTTVLATALLLPAPAWAGDVQREEFTTWPSDPWEVSGWATGGLAIAKVQDGKITIGESTGVTLPGHAQTEWTGSANRLAGWDLWFRMRLGSDTTQSCDFTDSYPAPTLLWVGDTTDLVQIGFGTGALCIVYPSTSREVIPLDTHRWHTFHLKARGLRLRLVADGRTVLNKTLTHGSGSRMLRFATHQGSSSWDYIRYDTLPGYKCTIRGTDGPDVLIGTPGPDVICAGDGDDVVDGLGGDDVLVGGNGDDTLYGGPGRDLLQGGAGHDVLHSGTGKGRSEGGQGADTFVIGSLPDGPQHFVGGGSGDGLERDTVDYSARTGPVYVKLDRFANDGARGEGDLVGVPAPWVTETDIEVVLGGRGDDVLIGSPSGDLLRGGGGADLLRGLGGWDILEGRDGVEGNDHLDGGPGADDCTADRLDVMISCNEDPWEYSEPESLSSATPSQLLSTQPPAPPWSQQATPPRGR